MKNGKKSKQPEGGRAGSDIAIFGGGPSGLYAAWRLAKQTGFTVTIYEQSSKRLGGRIFTKVFDEHGTFIELGGMRYSSGHKVLNKTRELLNQEAGIDLVQEDFAETNDRLYFLRNKHIMASEIGHGATVPYDTSYNNKSVDDIFANLSTDVIGANPPTTRSGWCQFYQDGQVSPNYDSDVYSQGDNLGNIGYWNLMFDRVRGEGMKYAEDAGGYTSNVINWNAADALFYNGEFAVAVKYYKLKGGYSTLIEALRTECERLGVVIKLDSRLVSYDIAEAGGPVECVIESSAPSVTSVTHDRIILAMPRDSIEIVAKNCMSVDHMLQNADVKLFLESVIPQASFKIGMVFDKPWWLEAKYKPNLSEPSHNFGPSIVDIPLRQIYYFGQTGSSSGNYVMLASYDDMFYTRYWQELELDSSRRRQIALSEDTQPLGFGDPLPEEMLATVIRQLAEVHFAEGDVESGISTIKSALTENGTVYMDWSLPPFGGGYHGWAPHHNICEVMQKIRRPSSIIADAPDEEVYIIGSAYSNDQAWVEGAFCTAESVLTQFFAVDPIGVDVDSYPLVCEFQPTASA